MGCRFEPESLLTGRPAGASLSRCPEVALAFLPLETPGLALPWIAGSTRGSPALRSPSECGTKGPAPRQGKFDGADGKWRLRGLGAGLAGLANRDLVRRWTWAKRKGMWDFSVHQRSRSARYRSFQAKLRFGNGGVDTWRRNLYSWWGSQSSFRLGSDRVVSLEANCQARWEICHLGFGSQISTLGSGRRLFLVRQQPSAVSRRVVSFSV